MTTKYISAVHVVVKSYQRCVCTYFKLEFNSYPFHSTSHHPGRSFHDLLPSFFSLEGPRTQTWQKPPTAAKHQQPISRFRSNIDAHLPVMRHPIPYFHTLLQAAPAAHQLPPPPFYEVLAGNASGGMSRGGEARETYRGEVCWELIHTSDNSSWHELSHVQSVSWSM